MLARLGKDFNAGINKAVKGGERVANAFGRAGRSVVTLAGKEATNVVRVAGAEAKGAIAGLLPCAQNIRAGLRELGGGIQSGGGALANGMRDAAGQGVIMTQNLDRTVSRAIPQIIEGSKHARAAAEALRKTEHTVKIGVNLPLGSAKKMLENGVKKIGDKIGL